MSETTVPFHFHELVESACKSLSSFSPEQIWPIVQTLEFGLGTNFISIGTTLTYKLPREIFTSADAFMKALAQRTYEARTLAFPILATINPVAATPIFIDFLDSQFSFYDMSYEAGVMRAVGLVWAVMLPHMPATVMVKLWLEGKCSLAGLTDEHVAQIPIDNMIKAIHSPNLGYIHRDIAERIVTIHPQLRQDLVRANMLKQLVDQSEKSLTHAESAFIGYLIGALVANNYQPIIPTLEVLLAKSEGKHLATIDALIRLCHRPFLEQLAVDLPALIKSLKLKWDPHHITFDLVDPIRAVYSLDPSTATERFAAYLTAAAVASDMGAKIAFDIMGVGQSMRINHNGTNVRDNDPDWLAMDPHWIDIAVSFADHPLLCNIAASILKRVPLKERKARLATAGKLPPPKKHTRRSSRSTSKSN